MRSADHLTVRLSARPLIPIGALAAAAVLFSGGSGLAAGALLALTVALHALVFGATATRRAAPTAAWRVLAALAVLAGVSAACAPSWRYAPVLNETALAAAFAAAFALLFAVLIARAPTLRDEDW